MAGPTRRAAATFLLAAAAMAACAAPAAGAAAAAGGDGIGWPDLDALVRHETRASLASGVTRVESWSEHLVRRGDTVWTERLRGDAHGQGARAGEAPGRRHFDPDGAARLVDRDAQGRTRLRFVDAARRLVVAVPAAEWETVGFDGRRDAAAQLVPTALVEAMAVERRHADGTAWRVQHAGGWTHRVLWSGPRQVALRIESRSDDGRRGRTVTVEPRRAAAAVPWRGIDGHEQRDYADFMD